MKHWRIWVALAILVFIGLDLFVWHPPASRNGPVVINQTPVPPLPTLNPDTVAQGEALYQQHCATCHGAQLQGAPDWKTPLADRSYPPPPHDSTGHTWHHPDELLLDITANGGRIVANSKMPAFKDKLSEEQIVAILTFIKSKWGREEREFQWWMTATSTHGQK